MSSEEGDAGAVTAADIVESFKDWYHYIALALLMGFMLGIRLQPLDRFTGHDPVQFQGVDSYYHWRTTEWTVNNFPFTMPFEIFTRYPTGTQVGQFGTLFDQLIALLAMIIGLGSPDQSDIVLAALIGVPIIAMLVAIPVYKIGERLGSRPGAIIGVAILAIAPGQFLSRSTAGMFQHHAIEALFMAITILAMMVALRVAEVEKPVYELILDRDWDALRRPTLYSVAAGVAMTFYIWVWPPAVVLIGIFGMFFAIALVVEHVRGAAPEHLAFVGAVSMATTGVLSLGLFEEFTTSTTSFGILQPSMAFMVAIGCVFMAWLSRVWYARQFNPLGYPVAVGSIGVLGLVAMAVLLPEIYSTIESNVTGRLVPFNPSETALTVQEARPPDEPAWYLFEEYGFAFYTFLLGLAAIVARPFIGSEYRSEHLLIVVWSIMLVSMGLTQVRFNYYLLLAVAVVNAYLFSRVFDWIRLPQLESITNIKGYQVLSLFVIAMVLFMPLLPPVAMTSAFDVAEGAQPSLDGQFWAESNEFLQENTPAPGDWGEHANSDEVDYMGTYSVPSGSNYDYPPGTYGVMSWWDYGHLITSQGERIPHANPFQHNSRSAASFFLADGEDHAELVMDAIEASGDGVSTMDEDELESIIAEGDADDEMRFVMIDDQMAAGKFSAMAVHAGIGFGEFLETDQYMIQEQEETLQTVSDEYHDTMIAKLYHHDTNGLDHYRLVHETNQFSLIGGMILGEDVFSINSFPMQGEWEDLAELDMQLRQAQFFNQVVEIPPGIGAYDASIQPTVKTFERVDGATITGTVENASHEVLVEIQLETNANRTITYTDTAQPDDDGYFEVTVPYATENELGPEDGYTDPDVETVGNFSVQVGESAQGMQAGQVHPHEANENVTVTERAVYDGEEVPIELEDVDRPAVYELDNLDVPENVTVNETVTATVDVENTGDLEGDQDVALLIDGDEVTNQSVVLEGGEQTTLTFNHTFDEAGEYELAIASEDERIEQTINATEAETAERITVPGWW